jgi:hypothetical protein
MALRWVILAISSSGTPAAARAGQRVSGDRGHVESEHAVGVHVAHPGMDVVAPRPHVVEGRRVVDAHEDEVLEAQA